MSGLSCSIWYLVSWSGIELRPPALGVQSLSHWATREVLRFSWINIPSFLCAVRAIYRQWHTHIYIYDFITYIYSYCCSTEKRVCRAPHTTIPSAHYFLLLSRIPLYVWATICLFTYPLMNIWVVSSLRLLQTKMLWLIVYKTLFWHMLSNLLSSFSLYFIPPRNGMTGLYRRLMLKILRNY